MAEPTPNNATSTDAGELGPVAKEKLCRRCKRSFDPAKNSTSSCRFHPSFFVCRRHDDQKRYYELGPDDPPYAAKFYDCCGAEDPDALGCTTDFHVSYDDH
ncbi:hypothetical protein FCM35_KLT19987 [Carex littledalei]|uniref:Uncharacterized protein n=1 Tax=Carex littledalei TaxID=544730 RepID=A0A833QVA0_9POAL|nr:hypothetical protein FCM35_KLT19987 [Carex littledalei]